MFYGKPSKPPELSFIIPALSILATVGYVGGRGLPPVLLKIVAPVVVFLLCDLTGFQPPVLFGPKAQVKTEGRKAEIRDVQLEIRTGCVFLNGDPVPVFQCEKNLHQPCTAVNVRHSKGGGG